MAEERFCSALATVCSAIMGLEQPIAIALDNSRIKQATRLASMLKQTIARKLPFTRSIARWLINDHFS
jgi:hypothetical protein